VRREEKGKRGKGHRWELTFTVSFPDVSGLRALDDLVDLFLILILPVGNGQLFLLFSHAHLVLFERSKKKNTASAAN
jgi:hypothetical protein